jgi:hypothetical protein
MPLVDKDNGNRLRAELGRLMHLKINTYMRNVLIEIFGKVWPDIVDAVDLSEYQDSNSEFHIRDALNNIVERFPFAVALKAIEKHYFKGGPQATFTPSGSKTSRTCGRQSRTNPKNGRVNQDPSVSHQEPQKVGS